MRTVGAASADLTAQTERLIDNVREARSMSLPETAHFTAPCTGGGEHPQQGTERRIVLVRRGEQCLGVADRRWVDLWLAKLRWRRARGRVGRDPTPSHCLAERAAQHGMDVADRRRGQAALADQARVVRVESLRRHLRQRQLAEVRLDPLRDQTAMLAQGGGGRLFLSVVEPAVEQLSQGCRR